jgi:hypothetical protein
MRLNEITTQFDDLNTKTEKQQITTVSGFGWAIRHIENPSESVQLAAVNQHGASIQFIENPSETVQLAAVRKHWSAIRYIKNPTTLVIKTALTNPKAVGSEGDYENTIVLVFANNALLMKKWLRYGKVMRGQK